MEKPALVPKRIILYGKIKPFDPDSIERKKVEVRVNRQSSAGEISPALIDMLRTQISQRSNISGHFINLTATENGSSDPATIFTLTFTTDPANKVAHTNITEAVNRLRESQIIEIFAAGTGIDPTHIKVVNQ